MFARVKKNWSQKGKHYVLSANWLKTCRAWFIIVPASTACRCFRPKNVNDTVWSVNHVLRAFNRLSKYFYNLSKYTTVTTLNFSFSMKVTHRNVFGNLIKHQALTFYQLFQFINESSDWVVRNDHDLPTALQPQIYLRVEAPWSYISDKRQ